MALILVYSTYRIAIDFYHQKESIGEAKEQAEKFVPDDIFFLQRSYPSTTFDMPAYEKALAQVQQHRLAKQGAADKQWQLQGPGNIGGRITCIAALPSQPDIIYVGTARGGVFKTTDGGTTWQSLFDAQTHLAIGDIEIDPNNPSTVYVGTGDKEVSGYPAVGNGLFKSTDGGITWQNIGLQQQRIISKINVHATNSNLITASAMGLPFEPDEHRGLYRSADGGNSWQTLLQVNDSTGVIDFLVHPQNPDIIYAASWERLRSNRFNIINGLNARIRKTTDGGATWQILSNGLPADSLSRIGLAMHPDDPNIIFAEIVGKNQNLQGVYKSPDSGATWQQMVQDDYFKDSALAGFGWYFGKIRINPFKPQEIYLLGVDLWRSEDEGEFWNMVGPQWWTYEVHADKHDLLFLDAHTLLLATDGGLYKSTDGGTTWKDIENLPVTQFYRVAYNPHQANDYWGGAQDNGTMNGNTDILNDWLRRNGGDGFQVRFHPESPNVVYSETQWLGINVSTDGGDNWQDGTFGIDMSDRMNWDGPYFISPNNSYDLYCATHRVYKSEGSLIPNWSPISEDLTDFTENPDEENPKLHTISSIAEAKGALGLLYVGTSDGNVWRSNNAGTSWERVDASLPDRYVTHLFTSYENSNRVWLSYSGYKDNDDTPHLFRSDDAGDTWLSVAGDLPNIAINRVAVMEGNEDVLFVATDGGVYFSQNGGTHWELLGNNLPIVPVYDIEIDATAKELIAGTFGRSLWTIDIADLLPAQPCTLVLEDDYYSLYDNPQNLFAPTANYYATQCNNNTQNCIFFNDDLCNLTPLHAYIGNPMYGTLNIINAETGAYEYLPPNDFSGVDFLQYQVCVEENNCATAWVYFEIVIPGHFTLSETADIQVYPNIFNEYFEINNTKQTPSQIQVFDAQGKLMMAQHSAAANMRIDTDNWSNGMYFLYVRQLGGAQHFIKLIKSNHL
ncbi:MAG: T9SS type A sorting domain-containing protein [Sphingobacteriales bacterium]|nr:T9SS type A sorting domain-containing protein [Sphingobacteriales bacterium]